MRKLISDIAVIGKVTLLSLRESFVAFLVVAIIIPLGLTYIVSLSSPTWSIETKINYLTGMLVLSASLTLINGVGQMIAQHRAMGIISWYRTSPVHPVAYVLGIVTTYLLSILLNIFIIIPLSSLLWKIPFNLRNFLIVIPIILLGSVSLIGIGAIIGTRTKSAMNANAITNLLSFVIAFATPAYYSIDKIPQVVRPLTYLLPTTEVSILLKDLYLKSTLNGSSLAFLLLLGPVYLVVGLSGIKWREN
ncbi:ABC transporter permease [Thermococcus sp.]